MTALPGEPGDAVRGVEGAERGAALVHGDHLRDAAAQRCVLRAQSGGPAGGAGDDPGRTAQEGQAAGPSTETRIPAVSTAVPKRSKRRPKIRAVMPLTAMAPA